MIMRKLLLFIGISLFSLIIYAQDCNYDENARRFVVRGDVAIKEATKDEDFISAAEEFKKALQYAPNCPDIYESIGACYEKSIGKGGSIDIKSYSEAIKAYKKYLELKPNLPNKEMVLNTIYELEYKCEKLCVQKIGKGMVINGVCWAIHNVDEPGTFATTPESTGKFYQWNRRTGWNATEYHSGWDNSLPSGESWTIANDPSPAGWRIPTKDEIDRLSDETEVKNEWFIQNGVQGIKFTDKSTGNSIFLPAAGIINDGKFREEQRNGYYWTNTLKDTSGAYSLRFGYTFKLYVEGLYCKYGANVRCVAE